MSPVYTQRTQDPAPGLAALAALLPGALPFTGESVGLGHTRGPDYRDRYAGAIGGRAIGAALAARIPKQDRSIRLPVEVPPDDDGHLLEAPEDADFHLRYAVISRTRLDEDIVPTSLALAMRWRTPPAFRRAPVVGPALERLDALLPWDVAGAPHGDAGGALRIDPVALVRATDLARLRREAALVTLITDTHPTAVAAAVAHAFAIAWCLHRPAGTLAAEALLEALARVLGDLHDPGAPLGTATPGGFGRLVDRLRLVALVHGEAPAEALALLGSGRSAAEAVPAALWCFLRAPHDPQAPLRTALAHARAPEAVAPLVATLSGAYLGWSAQPLRHILRYSTCIRSEARYLGAWWARREFEDRRRARTAAAPTTEAADAPT